MALRYWLIVIGLGCIFGSSFAGVQYALREVGPFNIGGARSLVAALACWAFLLLSGRKIPRDADVLWKLMLLGVFSYAFGNVFGPLAQQHISSGRRRTRWRASSSASSAPRCSSCRPFWRAAPAASSGPC